MPFLSLLINTCGVWENEKIFFLTDLKDEFLEDSSQKYFNFKEH